MAFEKIVFAMKTWKDKVSGNTPVTAAELNRIEKGISDCAKQTNALGDSVSRIDGLRYLKVGRATKGEDIATLLERIWPTVNQNEPTVLSVIADANGQALMGFTYKTSALYGAFFAFSYEFGTVAYTLRNGTWSKS